MVRNTVLKEVGSLACAIRVISRTLPGCRFRGWIVRITELLELVHTDVLLTNVLLYGGRRYVVTFVDDHSRMLWVEALARKSDVIGAFQRFKAAAENRSGKHSQRLCSDNGGEYMSRKYRNFMAGHGIHHEMLPPYSLQANRRRGADQPDHRQGPELTA